MALLIIVLGLLMAGVGAFFIVLGFDIVMTERGAAMTIAGSVALAGGVVTLGLGCAILRLTQMLRALEARGSASPTAPQQGDARASGPTDVVSSSATAPASTMVAGTVAAGTIGQAAAAMVAAGEQSTVNSAVPDPEGGVPDVQSVPGLFASTGALEQAQNAPSMDTADAAEKASSARGSHFMGAAGGAGPVGQTLDDDIFSDLDSILSQPISAPSALAAGPRDGEDRGEPADESLADQRDDALRDIPDHDGAAGDLVEVKTAGEEAIERPHLTGLSAEPQVLGSYNAGGRIYTMFSDGSVEAVTPDGVERFPSMESLRAHLART